MDNLLQPFPTEFASPTGDADLFVARSGELTTRDADHMHRHDFYEFVWLNEGTCIFFSDFRRYALATGTLIFIAPGQLHAYIVPEDHCRIMIFGFRTTVLTATVPDLLPMLPFGDFESSPILPVPPAQIATYEQLFTAALQRFDARVPGWEPIATAYLQTALTEAAYLLPAPSQARNVTAAQRLTAAFRRQMEQQYVEVRSVSIYAEQLGVTTNHLVKAVRMATGHTPKQMLQTRLLLEAKRLLVHSDAAIGLIGQQLQFKDDTTFSRWFRNQMNLTPNQFRAAPPLA